MRPTIVLFPGSLGDGLCFVPALRKIAARDREIILVCRGLAREFFDSFTCLPSRVSLRTVSFDETRFAALFSRSAVTRDDALAGFFSSAARILSWCGSAVPQFGQRLDRYLPGRVRIWPFFTGQTNDHASTYYVRCLGETLTAVERRAARVEPKDDWHDWSAAYRRQHGWESKRILVVHPGSGGRKKRWASEGFFQVAAWWAAGKDCEVLILLGPAESDEAAAWREVGSVENSLALGPLGSLLQRAAAYVGNDSGVSHLAGALGARGAVVFGPTRPEQWRPLGAGLHVLRNRDSRTPTGDRDGIALDEVPSEQVVNQLRAFIEPRRHSRDLSALHPERSRTSESVTECPRDDGGSP